MYQLHVRKNIVLNYSSPHCGSASLSILMTLPDSGWCFPLATGLTSVLLHITPWAAWSC